MSKEQLKKWIKILALAVLAFIAVYIIFVMLDAPGFVTTYFDKPFFCIIPLCLIGVAGILHIIYMFVEKGEPLRIIGNIFVGILVVYIVFFGSNITHAEYNNRDRYKNLDNLETKIVNNIFEDASIKEDDYRNSYHWSAFKTMIYESEYNGYDFESNESIVCSTDSYCVDNYALGYNKVIDGLENKLNVLKDVRYDDIILTENEKTGNYNGMEYKCSYAEIRNANHNRYYTRLAILVTSDDSAYLINMRISNDDLIEVNMEQQTQKLIDLIKSMEIFI
ncbi:MAG: hypothetical protein E7528_03980 [Ruminococcaceae bacterium]|nr:hypothetical protein [Oscillospiraceae bacterium]